MKKLIFLLFFSLLLAGCAPAPEAAVPEETSVPTLPETAPPEPTLPPETAPQDPIDCLMASMPLEQWVGQLFLVGTDGTNTLSHIEAYAPGGFLLFASDFANETPGTSAAETIARWQSAAKVPMLMATDEEGGTVTRISRYPYYRDRRFAAPRDLYAQGGTEWVLAQEAEKCALLASLGVNVNLGPVCDITTDPNAFMYKRSLGLEPETAGQVIADTVRLMKENRIGSALKHFPGYGNNADTHTGIAVDSRSLEALEACDLVPFRYGIDAGCGAVMVSHTVVEALDPALPASLSPAVHRYLRETMGFTGVILTDDLTMQAITDRYGAGEAAVQAVLAGNDLLCSSTFLEQYEAVLAAVLEGRIDFDTLKSAVRNVLEWKMDLGLI